MTRFPPLDIRHPQPGDTLWDIATKNYGDGTKYPIIAVANRDVVDDPDLIFPGQELRIPVDPSAI